MNKRSKNKSPSPKNEENTNNISVVEFKNPIERRTNKLLKNNGMLDGYKYVMANICKDGLPKGDVFEYSAYLFASYEKKWKALKSKEVKEKIMKYKEEKQKSKMKSKYFKLNIILLIFLFIFYR